MLFTPDQAATLGEVIRWRRDVRHFEPDPVPKPVLERLRAVMDCAPSVGNARPWRVIRVEDAEEGHGLGRLTMPESLRQSTAMAIDSLWLAARTENLGLGMVSILDPRRMEAIFEVPASWEFSAYLCLGRASFSDDTPLLERAGWQESRATAWESR